MSSDKYVQASIINIGSGNDLLTDGTKPLSEPMLTYHHRWIAAFTWKQFCKKSSSVFGDYTLLIITTSPRCQWVNGNGAEVNVRHNKHILLYDQFIHMAIVHENKFKHIIYT